MISMKASDIEANAFIDQFISSLVLIPNSELEKFLFKNERKAFQGVEYLANSWIDSVAGKSLLVVEIERIATFHSIVLCRGMLLNNERSILGQEEMWNLGLG